MGALLSRGPPVRTAPGRSFFSFDGNSLPPAPGAPHLTFAVRSDLPAAEKRAILQVLLGAHRDPDAATYFRKTGFPGLEPARLSDCGDPVKRLGLD